MHADSEAAEPIHREKPGGTIIATEVLIIGFGFSVIPLLRGARAGWHRLRDHLDQRREHLGPFSENMAALDFDMVSQPALECLFVRSCEAGYQRSRSNIQASTFIREYLAKYRSKVTNDIVTLVENYPGRSNFVRTQSGKVFEAKHLVVATAFKRKINHILNELTMTPRRARRSFSMEWEIPST